MSCRGDLGPAHRVRKNRVVAGSLTVEILVVVTSWPCVCSAEAAGGAEKKPKLEMSEDELRGHVQKGTLGKLTVPVLKDACKQFGVKVTGTKKQELIDALTAQLTK